jgi:hypothetical protein
MGDLYLQPITLREARHFVEMHHRHHRPPQGGLFAIAVNDGAAVVGVVIVGRPVARMLQNGYTAEVTRCCTLGHKNAPSMLYAAAWRAARAMGYQRLITYTMLTEPGTTLVAAGWKCVGKTSGKGWDMPSRPRVDTHPLGQKSLWEVVEAAV